MVVTGCLLGFSLVSRTVGAIDGEISGTSVGSNVVMATGNFVGDGRGTGTGTRTGTGTGTGATRGVVTAVVTFGADIGILVGAGTFPKLLSMHIPSESMPTQSPINRFEQSKDGINSVSETATTTHQLHKSFSATGSLGFTKISHLHVNRDRGKPDVHLMTA